MGIDRRDETPRREASLNQTPSRRSRRSARCMIASVLPTKGSPRPGWPDHFARSAGSTRVDACVVHWCVPAALTTGTADRRHHSILVLAVLRRAPGACSHGRDRSRASMGNVCRYLDGAIQIGPTQPLPRPRCIRAGLDPAVWSTVPVYPQHPNDPTTMLLLSSVSTRGRRVSTRLAEWLDLQLKTAKFVGIDQTPTTIGKGNVLE